MDRRTDRNPCVQYWISVVLFISSDHGMTEAEGSLVVEMLGMAGYRMSVVKMGYASKEVPQLRHAKVIFTESAPRPPV